MLIEANNPWGENGGTQRKFSGKLIFSPLKNAQKKTFSQEFHFKGPRVKKPKKPPSETGSIGSGSKDDEKRPRTAFSGAQLARLKVIF